MVRDCTALRTIALPENLRKIEKDAFHGCSSLVNVSIPPQVADIGSGAFYGSGIRKVILPQDIRVIRWQTFEECCRLRMIYLPRAVTCVEAEAFYHCDALEKVCFEAELGKAVALEIGEGNQPLMKASIKCGIQRTQLV